jgi:hypothetical protein
VEEVLSGGITNAGAVVRRGEIARLRMHHVLGRRGGLPRAADGRLANLDAIRLPPGTDVAAITAAQKPDGAQDQNPTLDVLHSVESVSLPDTLSEYL